MYVKQRFKPLCKVLESPELNEAISIQGMSERYILQTRFEIYVLKYMSTAKRYTYHAQTELQSTVNLHARGGGVLPYVRYMGMCRFSSSLLWDRI